jgi:hypothetical protein
MKRDEVLGGDDARRVVGPQIDDGRAPLDVEVC